MITIHDVVEDLTKELSLTPEQQFLVTAKIKRLVHSEKISVYSRIFHYSTRPRCSAKGRRTRNKSILSGLRFMKEFAEQKMKTHIDMANAEAKQIVTWSVGTHVYKQEPTP